MADVKSMAIGQTGDDLSEQTNSLFFRKLSNFANILKQFTAFDILEDEVPINSAHTSRFS